MQSFSVTDKSGLVDFARQLASHGVELISTGGTARALREAGLSVKDISELTDFPEMLDGRVKTLHPRVHGGILYVREKPEHEAAVKAHGILPIDMVVVNLYAFEKTAARPGAAFEEVIENIDIGGPSMVRSAAKNFEDVAIVTSAADYAALAEELNANGGGLTRETRWLLARAAFAVTAAYDTAIANTLERIASPEPAHAAVQFLPEKTAPFPATLRISYPLASHLRYGENPHQRAALYSDGSGKGVAGATQHHGKELSYNNLVDLDACWDLVREFDEPAVAIIKHTNPCGAATASSLVEAYRRALSSDPISAFGGVIGVNRELNLEAAEEMAKLFVEAIAAPSFAPDALARLQAKKNLRLIELRPADASKVIKQVSGGLLLQDADSAWTISCQRFENRHRPQADSTRNRFPALRLAGLQARQIERHRLRARRPDTWSRRRPDEPRRLGQVRCHDSRVAARQLRRRLGRLLPLRRWPRGGRRSRSDGSHSARRLGPR